MTSCIASGSRRSASREESTMSQKSTVTCLRSPSRALLEVRIFSARCLGVYASGDVKFGSVLAAAELSDLPHPPQNFSLPSFRKPQDEQVEAKDSPHSPQKRRPSRFSARQRGHCMRDLPGCYAGNGRTGAASLVWRSEGVKEGEWSIVAINTIQRRSPSPWPRSR